MSDKRTGTIRRLTSRIPKNRGQLEAEAKGLLKLAFWAALLAPVVIIPLYYLAVALLR